MTDTLAPAPETSRAATFIERVLKIPPQPHPPAGDPATVRVFRAARGFYWYLLVLWGAKQLGAGAGLAFGIIFLDKIPDFPGRILLDIAEWLGVAAYLAAIPFTYLMVHLDYQLRWYMVTDRSLRIREGIREVREKTMSFANIQNMSIEQGPVQRLLGIANLKVQTAGGGSASAPGEQSHGKDLHLAYFRGVDNAEEIRDAILARVRHLKDSGLGDPDGDQTHHSEATAAPSGNETLAAARELLAEARALRESAVRPPAR